MTSPSLPIKAPAPRTMSRHEREFLPAALEIVETPPSPIGRLGGYVMVAIFVVAVTWASLGTVDIVAVAKGKIIPTGYTKVIQPFETGVVRAIHVRDGETVKAGDILIELDPTMNEAELGHLQGDLMAAKIDAARLKAVLDADIDPKADFNAPVGATPAQADMGRRFYLGQVSQYRSKIASLAGEETQKRAEKASLSASIAKIDALLPMLQEQMQMRKTLFDHQTGSKISYLESLQALVSNQKDRDVQKSRLAEADAALAEAKAKREEMTADFRRTNLSELADAERKVSGLSQDVARAEQRTKYQALRAPIDGTVQQLSIHTVGGVVTPAETLLTIVPSDSHLEIEANVNNDDIGFVHAGEPAEIKIDTFAFTRYGLRHGTVVSVSQDAIAKDRGKGAGGDAKAADGATSEQPVYAARVSLDRTQMQIGNRMVNLSPGMGVDVEIKTGTRRIVGYLLSPLLRHANESLRER